MIPSNLLTISTGGYSLKLSHHRLRILHPTALPMVESLLNSMQGCLKLPAIALVILLTAAGVPGQAPSAGGAKPNPTPDYSKEAFSIEKLRTVARFENDGTSSRTVMGEVRVRSEAGVQQWGVLSTGYSSANEQVEIGYVRVRKADGTVVETPADSAQDVTSEVMRAAPMYSDYHEKHLAVKGLGVGDVLEYQVTTRLLKPLIPGQFWFAFRLRKGEYRARRRA